MIKTDTIAAIATAAVASGIGIIRISGSDAIIIADRIFRSKNKKKLEQNISHTIHYGWIYDGDELIDEVLVLLMKGPHSYTAEDTVEIDCHGGILVMKKVLEAVIRNGARIAEPGEFTKRAFLNGRIDLSQAEAVIDVINAKNNYALKSSVKQLSGVVSDKIIKLRKEIIYHIAYIESALDDPEHISLDGYGEQLLAQLEVMIVELKVLIQSSDRGRIMSEGVKTVIVGKPNVGKSSLMNVLLGEERAIVTDVAGTTRDTLEENLYFQGISLNIVDTAGIRDTEDIVEKIGISRAKESALEADLILYVVDSSFTFNENDEAILRMIKDQNVIVILNKIDLDVVVSKQWLESKTGYRVIEFSTTEHTGIDQLELVIKEMFYHGEIDFNDQMYITNVRHKMALENTLNSIKMVKNTINDEMPEDLYSIDLMDAYEELGSIIGESMGEDLVNEIFSKFCMGK